MTLFKLKSACQNEIFIDTKAYSISVIYLLVKRPYFASQRWFFIFMTLFWGLFLMGLQWPSLSSTFLGALDDGLLLKPLRGVSSLQSYWQLMQYGQIWDLQPLRDLSLLLDLRLSEQMGFSTFHISSFLLFLILLWSAYKCFRELELQPQPAFVLTMLLSLHPALTLTTTWISARKHLLACLFMLLAFYFFLRFQKTKRNRDYIWILAGLLLSGLSQPLLMLVGFWMSLQIGNRTDISKNKIKALALFAISSFFITLNAFYYKYAYVIGQSSLIGKFQELSLENLWNRFLLMGRFCVQVFLPINPSPIPYDLKQKLSILGLILFLLILFLIFSRIRKNYKDFMLTVLPILPVVIIFTDAGGMDTYLCMVIFFSLFVFAKYAAKPWGRGPKVFLAGSFFLWTWSSREIAVALSRGDLYWERAVLSEPSDFAQLNLVEELLKNRKMERAGQILDELWLKSQDLQSPQLPKLPLLLGEFIYRSPLSAEEKDHLFAKYKSKMGYFQIYYALHLAATQRYQQAYDLFEELWSQNPREALITYLNIDVKTIEVAWMTSCEKLKLQNCQRIHTQIQEESFRFQKEYRRW